jgi:hypothetical protein
MTGMVAGQIPIAASATTVTSSIPQSTFLTPATAVSTYLPLAGGTLTGPLVLPLGAVAATALNFGTANTGLWSAANQVNVSVAGVARLQVTSTIIGVNQNIGMPVTGMIAFQGPTVAPTAANYALYGDATNTYLNTTAGGIVAINVNNAQVAQFAATGSRLKLTGNTAAGSATTQIGTGPVGADTTSVPIMFLDAAFGTVHGSISRNGTNTVAFNTTSDARLKENLQETEIGLAEVMQLQVYDFTWKGTGEPAHGFIAQEVHGIYPAAVREGGANPIEEPWQIEYGRLTPLLVRAVQQQQALIEALAAEVAVLKAAGA